jgi:hypothetical protein
MNTANQLQWIDYLVMIIYFGFVLESASGKKA